MLYHPTPKTEKVAYVQSEPCSGYVFPRYMGGTVVSATSICNGAIRGKELPFQTAHTTEERRSDKILINISRMDSLLEEIVDVPADIVALYEAPAGETEEEQEIRVGKIKDYFETR